MKISMIISVLSSIALFNPVFGTPTPTPTPTPGVADDLEAVPSPMFWIGTPIPGGPEVRLNGTADEIVAQIREINPDWEGAPIPTSTSTIDEDPTHVKRYFQHHPTCDLVAGGWARDAPLDPAIQILRILGSSLCGAPRRSCARAVCNQNSGIELCNDRETNVQISCDRLAGAAEKIRDQCNKWDGFVRIVKGQWFDTTGYNVVVRSC
ncbi:hypothetical protein TWF718_007880 [Orbilia javanica]|uniref:Uncharacterized protein n=1 Tax=Orbilia javanica TaxID=47235 RepID=A0AAN8RC05_9PEZI